MTYPYNAIPSNNPQNLTLPGPINLIRPSPGRDPNANDNTYPPGTEWQNVITGMFFKCISCAFTGAVWEAFVPNASGTISSLTGNSGGAVGPDGAGNVNVVGDGTSVTIAGNPGTNTLTASLVGGGVAAQSFPTDLNGPVTPTAAGVLNLTGSTSTYTNGSVANTVHTEVQGTNHAVFIGKGVHVPASTIAVGTNGQVLIGATGADPAFASLTSTGNTISFTTGANSLNLDVNGSKVGETITGDSGGPLSPTAGNWNILGAGGTITSGAGSTLTITSTGLHSLAGATPSGGALTIPTFGGTYGFIFIEFNVIFCTASGDTPIVEITQDNGGTWVAAGYLSGLNYNAYNSATVTNINLTTSIKIANGINNAGSGNGYSGSAWLNRNASPIALWGEGAWFDTGTTTYTRGNFTAMGPGGGITGIRVRAATGISAGTLHVWELVGS